MEILDLLIISAGIVLIFLILLDVFLSVLHLDISGIIAPRVFRICWRVAVTLARRLRSIRRHVLAFAGPGMMVLIFLTWIGLFIVGFALIYWPNLSSYRSEAELSSLGFVDALYYSGITGTVLGYGDISPLTGTLKVCAFIQAGLGFALLTGIVTYLLSVSTGVTQRNSLALHLSAAIQGGNNGVYFLIRLLQSGAGGNLPERYSSLNHSLQVLHEKMHQFPILDLFYRSKDPMRDPEPMLLALTEISIAGQLLAHAPPYKHLHPSAAELGWTVKSTMKLFARQYMREEYLEKIENPELLQIDYDYLVQITERLHPHLATPLPAIDEISRETVLMAARHRIFFTELDRYTDWMADHRNIRRS